MWASLSFCSRIIRSPASHLAISRDRQRCSERRNARQLRNSGTSGFAPHSQKPAGSNVNWRSRYSSSSAIIFTPEESHCASPRSCLIPFSVSLAGHRIEHIDHHCDIVVLGESHVGAALVELDRPVEQGRRRARGLRPVVDHVEIVEEEGGRAL